MDDDRPLFWEGDRAARVLEILRGLEGARLLVPAALEGVRQGLIELGPRAEDGQWDSVWWEFEIGGVPALAKAEGQRNHHHHDELKMAVVLRPGPTARRWMWGSTFAYHMAWSFCDEAATVWIDRLDRPFNDGDWYWKARPKQVARRRFKELTQPNQT